MKPEKSSVSIWRLGGRNTRFAAQFSRATVALIISICAFLFLVPHAKASTPMSSPRYSHTATTLLDGKILLAGGWNGESLNTADIYDPATDSTTPTGSLNIARYSHAATLLQDGKVLLTGGYNTYGGAVATAEVYDPTTGLFTLAGDLLNYRYLHTATLLSNGTVLVAGGFYADALSSAEIYDPATQTFTLAAGNM